MHSRLTDAQDLLAILALLGLLGLLAFHLEEEGEGWFGGVRETLYESQNSVQSSQELLPTF